jgi:conjugal transfer pilus assembly protein TraV
MTSVSNPCLFPKPFNVLCPLFLILMLAGCSTNSEVFECEAGKGIGCKPISEVNRMVDQGRLGSHLSHDEPDSLKPLAPVLAQNNLTSETKVSDMKDIVLSDHTTVNRVQEEHLRVWVAPFQDDQGNLHEGSVIHTVIRPGYWQLTPRG